MGRGGESAVMDLTLSPKSYGGISTPVRCQAQSSCADSHCSLLLLRVDSDPVPEHQLQENFSVLNGSNPQHGFPRVLQVSFAPSFQVLGFLYLVDKHLSPLLFITGAQPHLLGWQSAIVSSVFFFFLIF